MNVACTSDGSRAPLQQGEARPPAGANSLVAGNYCPFTALTRVQDALGSELHVQTASKPS